MLKCILIILLSYMKVYSWNQRVRCDSNHLINNPKIMKFITLSLRDSKTSSFFKELRTIQNNRDTNHYARNMTIDPASFPCQNFFMSGQTCCSQKTLNTLYSLFAKYYPLSYSNTEYPIISFIRQIQSESRKYECGFPTLLDSQFTNLTKKYNELLNQIRNYEQKFINETICLLCLSPLDMPNFIYPQYPYTNINAWIINKQYFINKTSLIASILTQLQALHGQAYTLIIKKMSSKYSSQNTLLCTSLKIRATNRDEIDLLKICNNERDCKRISVQYFGEPAAPEYMLYIKMKSTGSNIITSGLHMYLALTQNIGFTGNITEYSPIYGSHLYPRVEKYLSPVFAGLW